jgi:predicted alpha/beta superfamily hydrolase
MARRCGIDLPMKSIALAVVLALALASAPAAAQRRHTLTGTFRTIENFQSRFLPSARTVLVYLPPGYDRDTARRYPVLYLHDGQNLFDGATSFIDGQEWRVDETAERLIRAGLVEPLIVVGVYNTGEQRMAEYTPVADPKHGGGQADLYGRLLVEELKPRIDAEFRTRTDAASTGLGGSSLGGLVSLYLGLKYPNVFGRLAVVSPSVWWADRAILETVAALPARTGQRIWVDVGTKEGKSATPDTRRLRDALAAKGWRLGRDLRYLEARGAEHNEAAWAGRFDRILRFLYPARRGR